jgi:hypothetical protein
MLVPSPGKYLAILFEITESETERERESRVSSCFRAEKQAHDICIQLQTIGHAGFIVASSWNFIR